VVGAVALGREKEGIDEAGVPEWELGTEMPDAVMLWIFLYGAGADSALVSHRWMHTSIRAPTTCVNFCGKFILNHVPGWGGGKEQSKAQ